MHRLFLLALVIFGVVSATPATLMPPLASSARSTTERVPAARQAALARGVNLSYWFWLARDASPEAMAKYMTAADATALKNAGFTHVRLPLDPLMLGPADAKAIDPAAGNAARLLSAVAMLNKAGLMVIVDAHPLGTKSETMLADKDPKWAENLEAFWLKLAPVLAKTDPNMVLLELLNEPNGIKDKAQWPRVQQKLLASVRKLCPEHTIVLTGDDWGGIDGLLRLEPVADKNVVYSFHFYEPHSFTHQGATWGFSGWAKMTGVPYPGSPELVEPVALKAADEETRGHIRYYGKENWNVTKVNAKIAEAVAWGKKHDAVLYCGEFGVYRKESPAADRLAWLRDVTAALAKGKVGWAMWEYTGGFGLSTERRPDGTHVLDDVTLKTIGGK